MTTNNQNQKELKELFDKFLSPEESKQAIEDIRRCEDIFNESPAPQPHSELIADIKSDIAVTLRAKRHIPLSIYFTQPSLSQRRLSL